MSALLLTVALLAGPAEPQDADLRAVAAPPGMFEGDFAAAYEALLSRLEEGRGPEAEMVSRLRDLDLDGDVRHRTAAGARRLEATARGLADAEASYQLRRMARRAFDTAASLRRTPSPRTISSGTSSSTGTSSVPSEPPTSCSPCSARARFPPRRGPRARAPRAPIEADGERRWEPVRRARHEAFVRAASASSRHGVRLRGGLRPLDGGRRRAARPRGAEPRRLPGVERRGGHRGAACPRVGRRRRAPRPRRLRSGWNALLVCLPGSDAGAVGARLVGADGSPHGRMDAVRVQRSSAPATAWAQGKGGVALWPGKVEHDPGLRYDGASSRGSRAAPRGSWRCCALSAPGATTSCSRCLCRPRAVAGAGVATCGCGRSRPRHFSNDVRRRMLVESSTPGSGGLPAAALVGDPPAARGGSAAREWRAPRSGALFERALPRFAEVACLRQVDRTWALAQPALEALDDHPTRGGPRLLMEHLAGQGDDAGAVAQAEAILRCDDARGRVRTAARVLEGSDSPLLEELAAAVEARRRAMPGSGFCADGCGACRTTRRPRRTPRAGGGGVAEARTVRVVVELAGARYRLGDRDGALEALEAKLLLEPGDPVTTEPSRTSVFSLRSASSRPSGPTWTRPSFARSVTDASVVEALDDGLVYYYPSGASLTRSHTLSIARDRAGTEALSRTAAAGRTREKRVLTLDGRELEPVLTEGEWVLPSLEPGDVVESVWENHAAANRGGPPASAGWRFASFEKAFPTSRWAVFVPEGLTRGRIELGAFDGRVETIPWEGGTVHVYEASSPRQQQEPWQPSYREVLPCARRRFRGPGAARLARRTAGPRPAGRSDRRGEGVRPGGRRRRRGIARARAIHDALEERLQDHQGLPDAARMWLTRSGDPLCLLAAMYARRRSPLGGDRARGGARTDR